MDPIDPAGLTRWLSKANLRCPVCNYSLFVYNDFDACCDNSECDWYFLFASDSVQSDKWKVANKLYPAEWKGERERNWPPYNA